MVMVISKRGIKFISDWEGCRLKAYKCPAGVWTIGVGHTANVHEGQVITTADAASFLANDLKWAEEAVNHFVRSPLAQYQYDALVSLVFNIGKHAFQNSTLLWCLNTNQFKNVPLQFRRWRMANGRVNQGLINRRADEIKLWNNQPTDRGN